MIWVRSQNKEKLINCENVFYQCKMFAVNQKTQMKIMGMDTDDKHYIIAETYKDYSCVGVYSTKEKALKVLDKLESYVMLPTNVVFQMPLDSEVRV